MSREILFRGKRIDTGAWVYGSFIPDLLEVYQNGPDGWLGDWGFIKPFGKTKEERLMVKVERETVGQYTGLTDKNGKKIFEGDILSVQDGGVEQYRFVVAFGRCGGVKNTDHEVGYMGFFLEPGNKRTERYFKRGLRNDIVFFLNCDYDAVVVGNIWDNPELLEVNGEDA